MLGVAKGGISMEVVVSALLMLSVYVAFRVFVWEALAASQQQEAESRRLTRMRQAMQSVHTAG